MKHYKCWRYMTLGRYLTNSHFLFGIWCLMSNEASSNFWSMMSCFTKWSTIYTSSSLYQHLTGTFFVYFSATKHTKFHIIVVILYSQEISYQYYYLLSGMPTPQFKICTKCDDKSVWKPVVLVLSKKNSLAVGLSIIFFI